MSTTNDSASPLLFVERALSTLAEGLHDAILEYVKAVGLPEEVESRVEAALLVRVADLMYIPRVIVREYRDNPGIGPIFALQLDAIITGNPATEKEVEATAEELS